MKNFIEIEVYDGRSSEKSEMEIIAINVNYIYQVSCVEGITCILLAVGGRYNGNPIQCIETKTDYKEVMKMIDDCSIWFLAFI